MVLPAVPRATPLLCADHSSVTAPVPRDPPLRLTPAAPLSQAMAVSQDLLEEIGGMKETQSRMGEDIRTIQEMLGLVSCCRCPREGAEPSPLSLPLTASPCCPGPGCHPA